MEPSRFADESRSNYVLQRTPGTYYVSTNYRGPAPLNTALEGTADSMAERTSSKIEAFCAEAGYIIPAGFWRHPAGRYAVIDFSQSPPKLVAKTWQKLEDLVYYLNNLSKEGPVRILDFKERREFARIGAGVSATGAF